MSVAKWRSLEIAVQVVVVARSCISQVQRIKLPAQLYLWLLTLVKSCFFGGLRWTVGSQAFN